MLVRIQCPTPNLGRVIHVAMNLVLKTSGRESDGDRYLTLPPYFARVAQLVGGDCLRSSTVLVRIQSRVPTFPLVAQMAVGNGLKNRPVLVRIQPGGPLRKGRHLGSQAGC